MRTIDYLIYLVIIVFAYGESNATRYNKAKVMLNLLLRNFQGYSSVNINMIYKGYEINFGFNRFFYPLIANSTYEEDDVNTANVNDVIITLISNFELLGEESKEVILKIKDFIIQIKLNYLTLYYMQYGPFYWEKKIGMGEIYIDKFYDIMQSKLFHKFQLQENTTNLIFNLVETRIIKIFDKFPLMYIDFLNILNETNVTFTSFGDKLNQTFDNGSVIQSLNLESFDKENDGKINYKNELEIYLFKISFRFKGFYSGDKQKTFDCLIVNDYDIIFSKLVTVINKNSEVYIKENCKSAEEKVMKILRITFEKSKSSYYEVN